MRALVADYIARTGWLPFVWGRRDCATWAADLMVAAGHRDPAAEFRGRYDSAFGCRRLVVAAGGLPQLIGRAMSGLSQSDRPEFGVAVIETGGQRACAILSAGRAVLKTGSGIWVPAAPRVLAAWGI